MRLITLATNPGSLMSELALAYGSASAIRIVEGELEMEYRMERH